VNWAGCGPQIFRRACELIENAKRQARAPPGEIVPSRHDLTRRIPMDGDVVRKYSV